MTSATSKATVPHTSNKGTKTNTKTQKKPHPDTQPSTNLRGVRGPFLSWTKQGIQGMHSTEKTMVLTTANGPMKIVCKQAAARASMTVLRVGVTASTI